MSKRYRFTVYSASGSQCYKEPEEEKNTFFYIDSDSLINKTISIINKCNLSERRICRDEIYHPDLVLALTKHHRDVVHEALKGFNEWLGKNKSFASLDDLKGIFLNKFKHAYKTYAADHHLNILRPNSIHVHDIKLECQYNLLIGSSIEAYKVSFNVGSLTPHHCYNIRDQDIVMLEFNTAFDEISRHELEGGTNELIGGAKLFAVAESLKQRRINP